MLTFSHVLSQVGFFKTTERYQSSHASSDISGCDRMTLRSGGNPCAWNMLKIV
ncbi:hypothetical protein Hanom_Chr01g00029431 [Helianthus anomalus]